MPKLFVFAIGGTGERVMRSFTMLLAAGVPTFDNYEVYPILIDYDDKNEDKKRTMTLLGNYQAAHDSAFKRHGMASNQFFASKMVQLSGLTNFVFMYKPENGKKKFRDHIGYTNLSGELLGTKNLLDTLYDNSDDPTTELNLDMTVGFRGNPNIGSVVFHRLKERQEFQNFKTAFQPTQNDKVIIIGSLFGGTGASGVPELVQAIREAKPAAKIATLLVVPYFAPAHKDGGAIDARRFDAKTKAALSYYDDSDLMDKISSVYYVGDPYPTVVPYSEGGETQKNNANVVELLGAMMIEHFVRTNGEGTNKEFKYSIPVDIVVDPESQHSTRIFIPDFDDDTKTNLKSLTCLAVALKCFKDDICGKKLDEKTFSVLLGLKAIAKDKLSENGDKLQDLCACLTAFYNEFVTWMAELDFEGQGDSHPANSHRLALYNLTKPYPEIIVTETRAAATNKRSIGNMVNLNFRDIISSNSKDVASTDYIGSRMNFHIDAYCDAKKLIDNCQKEFVFIDILRKASSEAVETLNK